MKPKTYWAGFVDGKMHVEDRQLIRYYAENTTFFALCASAPWIFTRRKDAKLYFDDVRKVEIREVK